MTWIDQAYIGAGRIMFTALAQEGVETFEPGTENLTGHALDVFGEHFHPIVARHQASERTLVIPPAPAPGPARRRRRFPDRVLAAYPLTQPAWRCQRCGIEHPDAPDKYARLELDHMMELAYDGPDHPHNLIRLCSRCHRAKPLPDHLTTFVEWRLAIITWALERPRFRWRDTWEDAPSTGVR